MVSYFFPPVKAIGSIRNENVAESFHKNGNELIVYSSDPSAENSNYKVIGINSYDLKYFLTKKKSSGSKSGIAKSRRWASKMMGSFPLNIFLGEGGFIYTIRTFWKLLKYRNQKVILYSSFRPMADHHAAYLFKLFNKKAYWVADFRDVLFDKDELDVYLPKFQEWVYKKMIRKADMLTTVSKGIGKLIDDYNDNIVILRNGVSTMNRKSEFKLTEGKFHISYTGALYSGRRDPSILFEAIQELIENDDTDTLKSQIQLNYAGREGGTWDQMIEKYGLTDLNNNMGLVTRDDALDIQAESDINLLLSWSSPNNKGILTGKFYEYIDSRKPVLCLLKGEQDEEFEEIFDNYKIGLLAYDTEKKKIKDFLVSLFSTESRVAYISDEAVKEFRWDVGFQSFIEKISR